MSSGPADLFGLIAFSLRRTESSLTVISVTEGTEQLRSLLARHLVPVKSSAGISEKIIY